MKFRLVVLITCMASVCLAQDYEQRVRELGIELHSPKPPVANYVKAVRTGNLIFLAGHGPALPDGTNITGKVGSDLTLEEGRHAARAACIALLSSLKAAIGDLNKVKRIVKVNGWVNCQPDFTDQPRVMNACSDVLVEIFGEAGRHARTSLGTNALPGNIAVEIEMVVEVE